jgi:2'-5' RNA ligase
MEAEESALIVPVPQTEPVVASLRQTLDTAAQWGVPAHVTVLYPFLAPDRITASVLADIAAAIATVPAFEAAFSEVRWFGDTVVWLAPQPDGPFRALTSAVWQRFPDCPPYGGAYDDVVPHLTVGHDQPRDVLARAADEVTAGLPVQAPIRSVRLIAGSRRPGGWQTLCDFPLGASAISA